MVNKGAVTFFAENGLPLQGLRQTFGQPDNGNYLGILQLISQFDPFLQSHTDKFGNSGRRISAYLSVTVSKEFVQLMGLKVLHEVVRCAKIAKYFSISVDSTPDLTHVDYILCYVSPDGCVEVRFLKFLPITSHTGVALFNSVLSVLQELGIGLTVADNVMKILVTCLAPTKVCRHVWKR